MEANDRPFPAFDSGRKNGPFNPPSPVTGTGHENARNQERILRHIGFFRFIICYLNPSE